MGSGLSDNYSYLDMSADELSAKGNGGLRILHSYVQVDQNQVIATPPDDYVPNKVGSVDMDKIMAQRSADIKKRWIHLTTYLILRLKQMPRLILAWGGRVVSKVKCNN